MKEKLLAFKPLSEKHSIFHNFDGELYYKESSEEDKEIPLNEEEIKIWESLDDLVLGVYCYKNNHWNSFLINEIRSACKELDIKFKYGIGERDSFGPVTIFLKFNNVTFLN